MPLGIGNNLIRNGGGLNPDQLALDLQFAADKTLTARKGPTPIFTRESAATQVGSTGLIEYAPENLSISLTSYTKVNFQTPTSISDGITADSLRYTPTGTPSAYMYMSMIFTEAVRLTISTYIRSSTLTTFNYRDFAGTPKNSRNFNPSTGQWAVSGGDTQFTGYTVESLSNGWYRISCNYIPTDATGSRFFGIMAGQNSATSVDLGGMQIERHPTARAYIPTTTAAAYGPRFDHDPVTLASRGLLIEEQRENTNIRSEEFGNAAYGSQGLLPVSSNIGVSPDGNTTADKIIENTSNSLHRLFWPNFSSVAGRTYTASIFVKSDGRRYFYFNAEQAFRASATFDLQNGIVSGSGLGTNSITNFGNGWYRCTIIGTAINNATVQVCAQINNTVSIATDDFYTGNGTSGLLLWGAQLEVGSFATSYIPTTTASVVRSADVCSITGGNFTNLWNNPAGTLISEAMIANLTGGNRGILQIDNDGNVHYLRTVYDFNFKSMVRANDTATTLINATGSASTTQKMGLSYEGTSFASCINGGAIASATRTMPVGLVAMRIGSLFSGFYLSGHISAIRYYKKRLDNAKLQALTV